MAATCFLPVLYVSKTHFSCFLYSNLIRQELLTSWNYCRESFCLTFYLFSFTEQCAEVEKGDFTCPALVLQPVLPPFRPPPPPGLFSLVSLEGGHILVLLLTSHARQTWLRVQHLLHKDRPETHLALGPWWVDSSAHLDKSLYRFSPQGILGLNFCEICKKPFFNLKSQIRILFSRPGLSLAYLDSYLTFEYMGQLCQSQRVKEMRCV